MLVSCLSAWVITKTMQWPESTQNHPQAPKTTWNHLQPPTTTFRILFYHLSGILVAIFLTNVNTHGKCCFRDFLFATLFSRLFIYIVLSLRQRILAHRWLRRRHNPSDIDAVLQAVETELSGSDRIVGYLGIWQRLLQGHNLVIGKETVCHVLRIVDPAGVDRRLRNRPRRRNYRGEGPNYIWHVDGYNKLKPFGFCIHGCIDG